MNKKAYLFTGYLGSGKTTSMIKVIEGFFKDKKVAVIVNEFGEVSIDGKILSANLTDKDIIEINEGCVCCVLYDELNKVLSDLQDRYDFDFLFIETSGLSEPFPIYSALVSLGFNVENIICLIDSLNYHKYINDDVFKYQIGSSNIIALNKIDLVEKSSINSIVAEIKELKERYNLKNFLTGEYLIPNYEIITTSFGNFPEYIFKELKLPTVDTNQIDNIQDKHTHQDYIQEIINYPNDSLTYEQFVKLVKNFPKNLVRAKGLIKLKDIDHPLLFNYSYGNFTFEEFNGEFKESIMVYIYKNDIKLLS